MNTSEPGVGLKHPHFLTTKQRQGSTVKVSAFCCDKYHDEKQLERKGLFLSHGLQFIIKGSQGKNSKQSQGRMLFMAYPRLTSSHFSQKAWTYLSWCNTVHHVLDPLPSIRRQENAPQTNLMEAILKLWFPLLRSVKLTTKITFSRSKINTFLLTMFLPPRESMAPWGRILLTYSLASVERESKAGKKFL